MAIQCNEYPNPSHNSALPQFLAHHNCEDLDPTDTPSAVPTALQAPKHFTHNPSTSQVKKSNHTNPMALPYPPDPGEHVMERSDTPTALVERDKLDPSSLDPPKGEIESSFSWTYLFKSPTSSTLCFGEPTLRKLTQVKLLFNPISSTKHTPHVSRVSDCHSSLVTTPSSRLILDKPKIEVTKALIHHIGKNGEHFYGENFIYDFPKSLKHIKEADWGEVALGFHWVMSTLRVVCVITASSTTLHLDTCSWKLTGETNPTTPHMDVLWLTGKVIKHITLTI